MRQEGWPLGKSLAVMEWPPHSPHCGMWSTAIKALLSPCLMPKDKEKDLSTMVPKDKDKDHSTMVPRDKNKDHSTMVP